MNIFIDCINRIEFRLDDVKRHTKEVRVSYKRGSVSVEIEFERGLILSGSGDNENRAFEDALAHTNKNGWSAKTRDIVAKSLLPQ